MSDKISLPAEYSSEIKEGMEAGGGIRLPFPAPYVWVTNGQKELKPLGGVSYLGGWNADKGAVDEIVETSQNTVPAYFKPFERDAEKGVFYGYETRHLFVAPIAFRQAWVDKDKKRHDHYVPDSREHRQVLCYLLDHVVKDKEHTYPGWGAVVISGKGYQARYIRDAFAAWEAYTAPLRREIAPGVPSYFFALCLGTFGEQPNYVAVGKTGSQSFITPIVPYLPAELTAAQLRKLYVGETIASIMIGLKKEAIDWLSAWKGAVGQDSIPSGDVDEDEVNKALATEDMPF